MVTGYLVIMTTVGFGLRRLYRPEAGNRLAPSRTTGRAARGYRIAPGWAAQARHVIGTAVGGYLLLMAVVIAYYYGVARVGGDFIQSAFTGTALLIGSRSRCSGWACG